jgi:hypothetical protein
VAGRNLPITPFAVFRVVETGLVVRPGCTPVGCGGRCALSPNARALNALSCAADLGVGRTAARAPMRTLTKAVAKASRRKGLGRRRRGGANCAEQSSPSASTWRAADTLAVAILSIPNQNLVIPIVSDSALRWRDASNRQRGRARQIHANLLGRCMSKKTAWRAGSAAKPSRFHLRSTTYFVANIRRTFDVRPMQT